MASYSAFPNTPSITESKREQIDSMLAKLNKEEMKLVRLFYWEGNTHEDIARLFKKSRRWVGWKLNIALTKMRISQTHEHSQGHCKD